jgi:predicted RNA-binding protein YlqC (UPF0109 family)
MMAEVVVTEQTPLEALVEHMVRPLILDPEGLLVKQVEDRHGLLVLVQVAQNDVGRVIGRQGRTIRAIRTLASAAGRAQGREVRIEVEEPEGGA